MLKILIINGVNLNMLGTRKKNVYGNMTLDEINLEISKAAEELKIPVDFYQSNIEGEIVEAIHGALGKYDGIIINPGAYSHYSIAIRDALEAVNLPCIEVHISNIYAREEFRHHSVISPICLGQISGLGYMGYILALRGMAAHIGNRGFQIK